MDAARPDGGSSPRPDRVRLLGLNFDRLALRLGIGSALLVLLPMAAGLFVLVSAQYERAIELRYRTAAFEGRILEIALRHQMVESDTHLMASVLDEIGSQPEVLDAMILNHEGEVRIATDRGMIGTRLERDSVACMQCHSHRPDERPHQVVADSSAGRYVRTVLPIRNAPECHRCHGADERINGILILDVSLEQVEAALAQDVGWITAGVLVLALFELGGVGLLVRWMVLVRLGRLGRSAREIAAGGPHRPADVGGRDVITELAADFDRMAHNLREMVKQLQEQERRLTDIVNSLDDGLVVLGADSRVVACNRSFGRRLDQSPDAILGRLCHVAGAGNLPCCSSEAECPAERCMQAGTVQRAIFSVAVDGGAGDRVEEVYASPVFGGDGQVVQVVEIWRDITERVQEEERLAEIERLVSLGALASGLSHEVNTPLATILTSADSILGRLDDASSGDVTADEDLGDAVRSAAAMIRTQVLRCRRITEQFLRFARGVPPTTEPLDLRDEIAEVVALVRPTVREAGMSLRVEAEFAPPLVRANSEVVRHVLLNLLVNALQSCERGRGEIVVSLIADDDVRIAIRDPGCGIAAEDRKHLFEPFRSKKAHGTGLGLFLSRNSMRRFGGDVVLADSEVGGGSCFHVLFATAVGAAR